MVRTKADGAVTKAVGAKAPRKQLATNSVGSSGASSDSSKKKPSGLPYCPQPTPEWQKSVTSFFKFTTKTRTDDKENDIEVVEHVKIDKGKRPANGKEVKPKMRIIDNDDDNIDDNDDDNIDRNTGKETSDCLPDATSSDETVNADDKENDIEVVESVNTDKGEGHVKGKKVKPKKRIIGDEKLPDAEAVNAEQPVVQKRRNVIESDDK